MSCKEIQDQILRFIDNDIKEKELEDFLKHINECQQCKEELEIYYSLLNGCRQLNSDIDVPDDFHESLMEKIRSNEKNIKKKKQRNLVKRYATAVASIIVLILGIQTYTLVGNNNKEAENIMIDSSSELEDISIAREDQEAPSYNTMGASSSIEEQYTNEGIFNNNQEYSENEVSKEDTFDRVEFNIAIITEESAASDDKNKLVIPNKASDTERIQEESLSNEESLLQKWFDSDKQASDSLQEETSSEDSLSRLGLYIGAFMIVVSLALTAVFYIKIKNK